MANRTNPMRRHSRFPVSWHVSYGNDAFLAEGTVLDLTALGWRVAGAIPVEPGMQLTLKVSVPDKPTVLCVQRATVLWAHNDEFAIEAHEMAPTDQAWVTEFLRQKLGLMWMSRITDHETPLQTDDEAPRDETDLSQPSIPTMEYILHRFLAIETVAADKPDERWDSDSEIQETSLPGNILHEARRILRHIVAIQASRERTGWDPIADN